VTHGGPIDAIASSQIEQTPVRHRDSRHPLAMYLVRFTGAARSV